MNYLSADSILINISLITNICYAFLFIYHWIRKNTNKSLMILSGYLCLTMVFTHVFTPYLETLDKTSPEYYDLIVNIYFIWIIQNSITFLAVSWTHKLLKIEFHYNVRYIFRCLVISTLLNTAMHIDIIEMGNREYYWLWSVFSYGENGINLFMFLSILIARKWSEVFKWLQSAHSY